MMITRQLSGTFLVATIFALVALPEGSFAHHCKGKHANDPGCSSPPPPAGEVTDPRIVYRDDGTFLANGDGTGSTQVLSINAIAHLDVGSTNPSQDGRILYEDSDAAGETISVLPYKIDANGVVVPGTPEVLVSEADILAGHLSANFTSFGLTDWSQGGDKYAYSYWFYDDVDGDATYRIMVAPIDDFNQTPDFSEHTLAWDGGEGGGLRFAAWDASGDYIYVLEDVYQGEYDQFLLVLDVRTNPATVVGHFKMWDLIAASGFDRESNSQSASAGSLTGATAAVADSYSFDPAHPTPEYNSDTSLCLMIPFVDWSTNSNSRFLIILDLPGLFDPMSGLSCPYVTPLNSPILGFDGTDFAADDSQIIGKDLASRKNSRGISILDLTTGDRTRIISNGSRPDWMN